MGKAYPGERFSTDISLTPAEVAAFARAAGDHNPVHHDPAFAAGTRYGRLIASGTQTSALLMGLTASHFSTRGAMVGLEFWFRFRRPVHADETVHVEWLVVRVTPHARLGGKSWTCGGEFAGKMARRRLGRRGASLSLTSSRKYPGSLCIDTGIRRALQCGGPAARVARNLAEGPHAASARRHHLVVGRDVGAVVY